MKQRCIRLIAVMGIFWLAAAATAGTWSPNSFLYDPDLGARGQEEKEKFTQGLSRVDAHLGKYKTLGDHGYSTLSEALATIGTETRVTLTIPAGTVSVSSDTTIGRNIALHVLNGGKFEVANGVTLTINGPIDAGPYQIFSGAGTINLGGVSAMYDVWFSSPPATPEGTIAAPVGSRFIKTNGSAPLVYVKESGTGNTGWVAAANIDHTHDKSQVGLANVSNDAQLKRAAGDIKSFPEKASPAGTDLILVEDSADSYNKKKIKIDSLPGGGSNTFVGMADTPSSYSGQAGKSVRVNSGETALEFYSPSSTGSPKPFITLGETDYATLSQALTKIGSTETTLVIPAEAGVVSVAANTTIPANVELRIFKGARFDVANGAVLTINGPIEAGPYQIFSWTGNGAINMTGSPTRTVYLEWWGAVPGNAAGSGPDCTAIFHKVVSSTSKWHKIQLLKGWYRHTSPLIITRDSIEIEGVHRLESGFYEDLGGSGTGVTFGEPGVLKDKVTLRNLGFIGPASSCTTGVRFIMQSVKLDNVNFWMGATEFGFTMEGCIFDEIKAFLNSSNSYPSCDGPAGPAKITFDSVTEWTTNVAVLDIQANGGGRAAGKFTLPLTIDGGGVNAGGIVKLTGSIENYTDPFSIKDLGDFRIVDLYVEGGGNTALIENCRNFMLENLLLHDSSCTLKLVDSRWGFLTNMDIHDLEIAASCRGITLGAISTWPIYSMAVRDYAPDTHYINKVETRAGLSGVNIPTAGANHRNIMNNSLFTRWRSDRPDGWSKDANFTWTKCGDGLADTTRHNSNYCAKITSSGGDPWVQYNLDSFQINQMRGHYVTWSMMVNMPAGQTLKDEPIYTYLSCSVPNWAPTTSYKIGEAVDNVSVTVSGMYMFYCTGRGTSGGTEPDWSTHEIRYKNLSGSFSVGDTVTWPTGNSATITYIDTNNKIIKLRLISDYPPGQGQTLTKSGGGASFEVNAVNFADTTDGTVTWRCADKMASGTRYKSSMAGAWDRIGVSLYIPLNVISVDTTIIIYREGTNEVTAYIAEPVLKLGTSGSRGLTPNQNEQASGITLNGLSIDEDAYIPTNSSSKLYGKYAKVGDVCFNNGSVTPLTSGNPSLWRCTAAGINGSGAAWSPTNMP